MRGRNPLFSVGHGPGPKNPADLQPFLDDLREEIYNEDLKPYIENNLEGDYHVELEVSERNISTTVTDRYDNRWYFEVARGRDEYALTLAFSDDEERVWLTRDDLAYLITIDETPRSRRGVTIQIDDDEPMITIGEINRYMTPSLLSSIYKWLDSIER